MQTSQDVPAVSVGAKLLNARWIEALTAGDGAGWAIKWTPLGRRRTMLLKHVIDEYDLAADAAGLVEFTQEARDEAVQYPNGGNDAAKGFWVSCLDELRLETEEDAL